MSGDLLWVVLGAYLIGSIPFGLLAGRLHGVDIRAHGSGNIGATNVFRICGRRSGITVFVLDVLKGLVPVLLAADWAEAGKTEVPAGVVAGVAAILGHNFPVWLKFKGGKGIATSAGVLAGLLPWALLVATVVWVVFFAVTRYVSLASVLAALSLPVTVGLQSYGEPGTGPVVEFVFAVVVALLAVWRHRANIRRLREGTEHRFGARRDKREEEA